QSEPHAAFIPLPPNPDDLLPFIPPPPFTIPYMIEAENLLVGAKSTGGDVTTQGMSGFDGKWSNEEQLWWQPQKAGESLTLQLPSAQTGTFELIGYFTKAKDYARIQVQQNGQNVGPEVNLYD